MIHELRAVYRAGVFVPGEACDLPENSEVDLIVQGPLVTHPEVTEQGERARILRSVTERMQRNPIPPNAQPFARDELHGRS